MALRGALLYDADERQRSAVRLPAPLHGPGSEKLYETVREMFGLEDVEELRVLDQVFVENTISLHFNFTRNIRMTADGLGEANGTVVTLGGSLTLNFDRQGSLLSYEVDDVAKSDVDETKNSLLEMVKNDEIYVLAPREIPDTERLMALGKRYYLRVDEAGNKRVEMAYVD